MQVTNVILNLQMVLDYVNKLQIPVISLLVGIFVVSNFSLLKTVLGGSMYKNYSLSLPALSIFWQVELLRMMAL